MTNAVALSSLAFWTPRGVWINSVPAPLTQGRKLAPWPEALDISRFHSRSRRPHTQAIAVVQLAQALLSARALSGDAPAAPSQAETDLLIGTRSGSTVADLDFLEGVRNRGAGFGSPSTFVYTLPTASLAEVAIALGLRGALATVTAGNVSGLTSVARAAAHVAAGRSRACLTGGIEMLPATKSEATSPPDFIALFLLETPAEGNRYPLLHQWDVGFGEPTLPSIRPVGSSELSTLCSVASAAQRGAGIQEISGSSVEGYWARLSMAHAR
ncbi:MAG TPA: beta-ketoacyl synthase N-terminal-like domain-containing protein [Myxococcaceae bacterium]|nr:beta-ketoacyl synthase N-terminal-like domain-containing protein [Myxococcaceae bacterium]